MKADAFFAALRSESALVSAFEDLVEQQKVKAIGRLRTAKTLEQMFNAQGHLEGLESLLGTVRTRLKTLSPSGAR